MDLLIGTLVLRPYVFGFLACYIVAGVLDLGWRRTLAFGASVWPVAWLAEFTSTRVGIPFGLYHYTGVTHGQELYLADVPFMDSLSFAFLAYAAFCLARAAIGACARAPLTVALAGVLMMLLDVVIDPVAVRGDRWFLGRIFYYPDGGAYFGVPLSNFAGWALVGVVSIGLYVAVTGATVDRRGRPLGGVALYYAVVAFNLAVTVWIGEFTIALVGLALHVAVVVSLTCVNRTVNAAVGLCGRGMQKA